MGRDARTLPSIWGGRAKSLGGGFEFLHSSQWSSIPQATGHLLQSHCWSAQRLEPTNVGRCPGAEGLAKPSFAHYSPRLFGPPQVDQLESSLGKMTLQDCALQNTLQHIRTAYCTMLLAETNILRIGEDLSSKTGSKPTFMQQECWKVDLPWCEVVINQRIQCQNEQSHK